MRRPFWRLGPVWGALFVLEVLCPGQAEPSVESAQAAVLGAVHFLRERVSVQGSYGWSYSLDLTDRRGEGEMMPTQGWVQPPGTPSVGMAFLRAYRATGEAELWDATVETARALVQTQLLSGGWHYRIEFDPSERREWLYRVDHGSNAPAVGLPRRANRTVFDDDTTTSALRFLIAVDRQAQGRLEVVQEAVRYGLRRLMDAQYPNGAWPQVYHGEVWDPQEHPRRKARIPQEWPREYPRGVDYWKFYTLNDHVMRNIIETLLLAYEAYGEPAYWEALLRGAEFLLDAQLPDPQAGWAQQYNFQMEPAWARRFEPPAVAAAESVGVAEVLLRLYRRTGDERYRQAVGRAVEWLRRSQLPNGRWARFYELGTNRPLYFTRDYQLTYSDTDLPTHYSFQGSYGVARLIRDFEALSRPEERPAEGSSSSGEEIARLAEEASRIIAAQDEQGRWITKGRLEMRTFVRHLGTLARYIEAVQRRDRLKAQEE